MVFKWNMIHQEMTELLSKIEMGWDLYQSFLLEKFSNVRAILQGRNISQLMIILVLKLARHELQLNYLP